jgi:serine phosphatase RsbU (regulator of sigma subunit)
MISLSIGNIINLIIISIGIGICSLNLLQINSAKDRIASREKTFFLIFFSFVLTYLCSHLARMLLEGNPGLIVNIIIRIVTYIEFMVSCLMAMTFSILVLYIAKKDENFTKTDISLESEKQKESAQVMVSHWTRNYKVWINIFIVLFIAYLVFLTIAQFNRFFYFFDQANVYHRGRAYILSNLVQVIYLIIDIYFLIRYRRRYSRNALAGLWVYVLLPIVAVAVQGLNDQIQFVIFATVISSINLFIMIMTDLSTKYEAQRIDHDRIETELNMASNIQSHMLPHIYPAFPDRSEFDIYASMKPAKEVGGDFYDYFLLDNDNLGVVMADVSGKGVPAALFMMISKTLVENYTLIYKDPQTAIEAVNNQICKNNPEDMFVTVWLAVLNLRNGKLKAINAGHEAPAFKQAGEDFVLINNKHGLVVGAMEGIKYKSYELELKPDSKLFLYTDGVAEATNASNELYGTDRMISALRNAQDGTPKQILDRIHDSIDLFVGKAPQFDDITMLCLHYKGDTSSKN